MHRQQRAAQGGILDRLLCRGTQKTLKELPFKYDGRLQLNIILHEGEFVPAVTVPESTCWLKSKGMDGGED
jgi:hypothetical protein